MGFSVSGATAVVLIGGLIAFSFAFAAATNGFERVSDARETREDRLLRQTNTAISIANATWDGSSTVSVAVNNTGSTALSVERVSLLVDGEVRPNATTSVDGDATTDLWLPGEQLTLEANASSRPGRVKVVTGVGVADTSTEVSA